MKFDTEWDLHPTQMRFLTRSSQFLERGSTEENLKAIEAGGDCSLGKLRKDKYFCLLKRDRRSSPAAVTPCYKKVIKVISLTVLYLIPLV